MRTDKFSHGLYATLVIASFVMGCGKTEEQERKESIARSEYAKDGAERCAAKIATTINLVDPNTKQFADYAVCPVDLMSGNVVCPSKNGGINFIISLPFEIPTNPKFKYPSVRSAIVYRGESLKFYCWLDQGYPVHIVIPNHDVSDPKQQLTNGQIVFSLVNE